MLCTTEVWHLLKEHVVDSRWRQKTQAFWVSFCHCTYWATGTFEWRQLETEMFWLTGQLDFNFFFPALSKWVGKI